MFLGQDGQVLRQKGGLIKKKKLLSLSQVLLRAADSYQKLGDNCEINSHDF